MWGKGRAGDPGHGETGEVRKMGGVGNEDLPMLGKVRSLRGVLPIVA